MNKRDLFRKNLKIFCGDFNFAGWYAFPHEPVVTFANGERERLLAEYHVRMSGVAWQPELFGVVGSSGRGGRSGRGRTRPNGGNATAGGCGAVIAHRTL